MAIRNFLPVLLAAILGGVVTLAGYQLIGLGRTGSDSATPPHARPLITRGSGTDLPTNFANAVAHSIQQVVHIRAVTKSEPALTQEQLRDPFFHFFGDDFWGINPYRPQQPQLRESTGSGVIVSAEGYIVTNLHVVNQAEQLEVTLNDRRIFEAKLIGQDPSTDLALIKIEEKNLPFIRFADSDKVQIGDWVVAVGNPFNLTSTVTAGIVSAKARSINVLRTEDNSAIESFIQTDAAVNPGNSGGALVNLNGELVGINTAIATPTGVYAGYAFAVPSNIVAKIIQDIRQYGSVRRGYLGITIRELDWERAQKLDLKSSAGIVVETILKGSAAAAAGLKKGDVILEVNGKAIASASEFLGIVAQHSPGDVLQMSVIRDGSEKEVEVKLKENPGKAGLPAEDTAQLLESIGLELEPLSDAERKRSQLTVGVRVKRVLRGRAAHQAGIREGFIITGIDRQPVRTVEEAVRALLGGRGGVLVQGTYPGSNTIYYYGLSLDS